MDRNRLLEIIQSIIENPTHETLILSRPPKEEEGGKRTVSESEKAAISRFSQSPAEIVSPIFKLSLLSVFVLTILSMVGQMWIAFFFNSDLTTPQQAVFNSLSSTWKFGFGAIAGLIGGKSV